jgi:Mg/Co/Ni transporter MgtE
MPDHPELEADIIKELDNERQARLLKTRSATEVVEVPARKRTDEAAGGLRALEFIALSENLTIGHALEMVRTATGQQR